LRLQVQEHLTGPLLGKFHLELSLLLLQVVLAKVIREFPEVWEMQGQLAATAIPLILAETETAAPAAMAALVELQVFAAVQETPETQAPRAVAVVVVVVVPDHRLDIL
jgi:hypothetical protein